MSAVKNHSPSRPIEPLDASLQLRSYTLGELPVINRFMDRLGLDDMLARYVPHNDTPLAPAAR